MKMAVGDGCVDVGGKTSAGRGQRWNEGDSPGGAGSEGWGRG